MKKKTILTLIIFINTIVFSQNISGKVTYVVSMESFTKEKIDSISKSFKKKKLKWINGCEIYLKTHQM